MAYIVLLHSCISRTSGKSPVLETLWPYFYVGRNGSVKWVSQVVSSVKQQMMVCKHLRML